MIVSTFRLELMIRENWVVGTHLPSESDEVRAMVRVMARVRVRV